MRDRSSSNAEDGEGLGSVRPRKVIVATHHPSPWAQHFGFRQVTDAVSKRCLENLQTAYPQTRSQWKLPGKVSAKLTINHDPSPPSAPSMNRTRANPRSAPSPPFTARPAANQDAARRVALDLPPRSHTARRPCTALTARTHRQSCNESPSSRKMKVTKEVSPVHMSPRIVTVGGSPRLKLFGHKGERLQLHKRGTTSSALLQLGQFGADGSTGSLEQSGKVLDRIAKRNAACVVGALGALRVLRRWRQEAVSFVRELWNSIESRQQPVVIEKLNWSKNPASRARAQKLKHQLESAQGLQVEAFQELLSQIGCQMTDDLTRRVFRMMIYPPHMDAVTIVKLPRYQLSFKQFMNGCQTIFSCGSKFSRNGSKRLKAIFNFYDFDRLGSIDRGHLYRGLLYAPQYQQHSASKRQETVLDLVKMVWKAMDDPEDWSKDAMSFSGFCRISKLFPQLTELFDLFL